jgi:hypothetical protein
MVKLYQWSYPLLLPIDGLGDVGGLVADRVADVLDATAFMVGRNARSRLLGNYSK